MEDFLTESAKPNIFSRIIEKIQKEDDKYIEEYINQLHNKRADFEFDEIKIKYKFGDEIVDLEALKTLKEGNKFFIEFMDIDYGMSRFYGEYLIERILSESDELVELSCFLVSNNLTDGNYIIGEKPILPNDLRHFCFCSINDKKSKIFEDRTGCVRLFVSNFHN